MAAATTASSVELAAVIGPSTTLSSTMGGASAAWLFFKWLGWGALCLAGAALVLFVCAVVYVAVDDERSRRAAIARRKREERLHQRRWSQMMGIVRDVPYEQVVADRIAENPCVVCRTEYEAGETCSLLPRCPHMFHKDCIAAWLRHHDTCPICNATVAPPDHIMYKEAPMV